MSVVLLDSGGVLNRSSTGHWFIGPGFFDTVDKDAFEAVSPRRRRAAFRRGMAYLDGQPSIPTIDDELAHFTVFYRIVFAHLGELGTSETQVRQVAEDLVFNEEKYVFFDDARTALPRLAERHRLAVVSDAWPSLEGVFRRAGLRDCFASFVVSSVVGVCKPDPLMYRTALRELGASPESAWFVDDHHANCRSARRLGISPVLLHRDRLTRRAVALLHPRSSVIGDLDGLTALLDGDGVGVEPRDSGDSDAERRDGDGVGAGRSEGESRR